MYKIDFLARLKFSDLVFLLTNKLILLYEKNEVLFHKFGFTDFIVKLIIFL
jgi:hypothetical protein